MKTQQNPVTRFAPSPNAYLHLGHAYSALIAFARAGNSPGRFLLRIEDIDIGRCREELIEPIYRDLAWLGLDWAKPVLRQVHRFQAYRDATDKLARLGILYPCFATRAEISRAVDPKTTARDPDGAPIYPGLYRDLPHHEAEKLKTEGRPFALRINMNKALDVMHDRLKGTDLTFIEESESGDENTIVAKPERWGDAVIVRKDVPTSYHLAVVVDDAFQNITHVTRGYDLFPATDIHRLLQVLLELNTPIYAHHRLINDNNGKKLSKSDGATSLRALREHGWTPKDVFEHLGISTQTPQQLM